VIQSEEKETPLLSPLCGWITAIVSPPLARWGTFLRRYGG